MDLPQLHDKSTPYNLLVLLASSIWIIFILLCGLITIFISKIKNLNNKNQIRL
jgi:hypothetical protein